MNCPRPTTSFGSVDYAAVSASSARGIPLRRSEPGQPIPVRNNPVPQGNGWSPAEVLSDRGDRERAHEGIIGVRRIADLDTGSRGNLPNDVNDFGKWSVVAASDVIDAARQRRRFKQGDQRTSST